MPLHKQDKCLTLLLVHAEQLSCFIFILDVVLRCCSITDFFFFFGADRLVLYLMASVLCTTNNKKRICQTTCDNFNSKVKVPNGRKTAAFHIAQNKSHTLREKKIRCEHVQVSYVAAWSYLDTEP